MRLYHIDRTGGIPGPGQLDNAWVYSRHGSLYWEDKPVSEFTLVQDAFTEHFFEAARMKEFPFMPSRFTSFFACDQAYFPAWWNTLVKQDDPNLKVWEVEAVQAVRLDAAMLQTFWFVGEELYFSPSEAQRYARAYWRQASIEFQRRNRCLQPDLPEYEPTYEYLLPYPVRVLRQVPAEEVAVLRAPAV